jgi:4-carboxymuconolactone decarboxylase
MTMKQRLPAFDPATATDDQKQVLQDILNGPRGNLNGPFLSWIHSPELAQHAQKLGAFCRYKTGLSLRLSEFAILCTAAKWRSQAEWHIHYPIGIGAGLDADLLEAVRCGRTPRFSASDEALIWRLIDEFYETKRISDDTYHDAESLFGTGTLVNLVGLLGYYALVAMTLNAFNVRAEGQTELAFTE